MREKIKKLQGLIKACNYEINAERNKISLSGEIAEVHEFLKNDWASHKAGLVHYCFEDFSGALSLEEVCSREWLVIQVRIDTKRCEYYFVD